MTDATRSHHEGGVMRSIDPNGSWNELAGRENEGLEISLFWSKSTDRVKVVVADTRLDEQFELDVAGADALAAFYHPFAFAASRGLSFGEGLRMSSDLQPQG